MITVHKLTDLKNYELLLGPIYWVILKVQNIYIFRYLLVAKLLKSNSCHLIQSTRLRITFYISI